ncbi:MAG: hypothetical protein ACR2PG_01950 [Hyphomicrobiaceae bacterium]
MAKLKSDPQGRALEVIERRSNGEAWSDIADGKDYMGPTIVKVARFFEKKGDAIFGREGGQGPRFLMEPPSRGIRV